MRGPRPRPRGLTRVMARVGPDLTEPARVTRHALCVGARTGDGHIHGAYRNGCTHVWLARTEPPRLSAMTAVT